MRKLWVTTLGPEDNGAFKRVWRNLAEAIHKSVASAASKHAENGTIFLLAYFYHCSFDVEDRSFFIVRYSMSVSLRGCLAAMPCVGYKEYPLSSIFSRSQ